MKKLQGKIKPLSKSSIMLGHPLAKNLVACWLFNEPQGTSIFDYSQRRNTALIAAAQTNVNIVRGVAGRTGKGLKSLTTLSASSITLKNAINSTTTFTLECWIRPDIFVDGYGCIFTQDATAGLFLKINGSLTYYFAAVDHLSNAFLLTGKWYHIVYSIKNGNGSLYINGILDSNLAGVISLPLSTMASDSSSETAVITYDLVRMWVGTALSSSQVKELYKNPYGMFANSNKKIPFKSIPPSSTNATATPSLTKITVNVNSPTVKSINNAFVDLDGISSCDKLVLHMDDAGLTDSSSSPKTPTLVGGVARSAVQSKFGGFSAAFDAAGKAITFADSSVWFAGTSDVTLFHGWVYSSTQANGIFMSQWESGSQNVWRISLNGVISFQNRNAGVIETATFDTNIPNNTWTHVVVQQRSGTIECYINGVREATTLTLANPIPDVADVVAIGARSVGGVVDNEFTGFLDEVVFSRKARYSTPRFNVRTTAFSNIVIPTVKVVVNSSTASTSAASSATATPTKILVTVKVNTATASTTSGGSSAIATPSKAVITIKINSAVASTGGNRIVLPSTALTSVIIKSPSVSISASRTASVSTSITRVLINTPTINTNRNAFASPSVSITKILLNTPTVRVQASKIVTPSASLITIVVKSATANIVTGGSLTVTLVLKSRIEQSVTYASRIEKYMTLQSQI